MENYPNPNSLAYAADPQGNAHLATDGTVQKVLNDIAKAVQTLLARSHEHDETQQAIVTAYKGWRRHMLVLFAKKPGARVVKGWGVWAGYCVSVELKKLLTELRTPTVLADPELAVNRLVSSLIIESGLLRSRVFPRRTFETISIRPLSTRSWMQTGP